jgi:hypothetical protein
MNCEIADRSMWVWSPHGENVKIKTMKNSSKAVYLAIPRKIAPVKISPLYGIEKPG